MSAALDVASWVLLVGGALLLVVSALGLLRLPDFFTRVHAAGVADTGGVGLLLLGMALQTGFDLVTAKLVLIGVVLALTAPTASHAVAHAAVLGGLSPDGSPADRAGDERDESD